MSEKQPVPARILIVEDHPIVRQGYQLLIGAHPDLEVFGQAAGEREALATIKAEEPDLAIVDLTLRDGHGLDLVKQIHRRNRRVRVLVISAHDEGVFAARALEAGALGYINKHEAIDNLIAAIRRVLADEVYLSEKMTRELLKCRIGIERPAETPPLRSLVARELEVFEHIGHGLNTAEIAKKMHLSPKTIERHKANIKKKLHLANATELVNHATQWVLQGG